MWYFARKLRQTEIERASTIREALRSTLQKLLIISAISWLTCALFFTTDIAGDRVLALMTGILAIGLIFALAYRLVPRYTELSLILWLAGMMIAVLLGSWILQNPGLVLLSSVLPLIAVITVSGWAGVLTEGLVIVLVLFIAQSGFADPLPANQALLIIVAGAFNGLFGWVARAELLTIAEWSITSFREVRTRLDDAREQRLELEQSREDLMRANLELARLTDRLKALERIADEARQAKTEFVANVSHELRTPLNMIIGFADVISQSPQVYGGRLPPSLLTDIAAIRRNAEHLAALVNDVLDLSQVEAGRMALRRDWVSLDSMLHESISVVTGLFESRSLYLRSEIDADPSRSTLPLVFCDETRIRQVIINLLGNAGRFTEKGGVVLRCSEIDNEVVISVTDTGPGIAEKDQERIFEPFQQADVSTRRRHGGSGLGLTISKQFVEMHGGKMWLESQPGQGTTIYFSLPLQNPTSPLPLDPTRRVRRFINANDEMGYRTQKRRSLAPVPVLTERFVVVDPEEILQRLLERYLPEVEVETAPDALGAVAALQRSPAQALIFNISPLEQLPTKTLGALPFGTPVFTCWLPGEHEAARHLGAVEYLIKPLAYEKLQSALARLASNIKTVLIVDDEEDELHLFARMLASDQKRYSVLQVTSGQRALAMLRSRKPDVMLLDLMMPGMNGFQVLEEKARDAAIAAIPVIIISSLDPAGDLIVGNSITVTQGAGISQRNLISCIHALGEILTPSSLAEIG